MNIIEIKKTFEVNNNVDAPVFYNQDWYEKQKFVKKPLEFKWYLLKKNIFTDSRAMLPEAFPHKNLPSAVLCVYAFFVYYLVNKELLWSSNFIWCEDFDDNGDRIYIGKYLDSLGLNKDGFSIHRHLAIRDYYGVIDCY